MDDAFPKTSPRILVPLDLTRGDEDTFIHALGLAARCAGKVHPVHVHAADTSADWHAMPRARDLLVRWGHLAADAGVEAFEALDVEIHPQDLQSGRTLEALVAEASLHRYDLVVATTHARRALGRLLERSTARALARQLSVPVLFLPDRAHGLIDPATGALRLRHVLLPVDEPADAAIEVHAAESFGRMLGVPRAHGTILHVGDEMPPLRLGAQWSWDTRLVSGSVAQAIGEMAGALACDLTVMATRGRTGLIEAIVGSHTERVLDTSTCPVLAVPIGD